MLCLEAANTTIHKYFVDDLSDLIDVSVLSVLLWNYLLSCNSIYLYFLCYDFLN